MHTSDILLTFTWDMSKGLDLGFITLRYYSLLFVVGFVLGYQMMRKFYRVENKPEKEVDSMLTYMVIATVVGARLGHVFFYDWDSYKNNLLDIFKVWEGGLASHGAAVAIILAMIYFSKKVSKSSALWLLDRVVITVALAGAFIRAGNMMNSEIYGKIANSSIETVYVEPFRDALFSFSEFRGELRYDLEKATFAPTGRTWQTDTIEYPQYQIALQFKTPQGLANFEEYFENILKRTFNNYDNDRKNIIFGDDTNLDVDELAVQPTLLLTGYGVPRYPTQVIESIGYLLIFIILFTLYWKTTVKNREGFLFGMFLALIFGFRFAIEFMKANQVDFEAGMQYNMGQWLSIPLVLAGLYFIFFHKKKLQKHE